MEYFVGGFAEVLDVNSLPLFSGFINCKIMVHLKVRVKGRNTEKWDILHSLELRTFKQTLSLLGTRESTGL